MRAHHLVYGATALAAAVLTGCVLSASQRPGAEARLWTVLAPLDAPTKDAEEKAEEFDYFIAGAKRHGTCKVLSLDLGKGVKMEFVRIRAGKFQMGSPDADKDADANEKPRHEVEITKDFYLGKYLVTQEQYKAVMGDNPSCFSASGKKAREVEGLDTRRFPVDSVSWDKAQAFCEKLSERAHHTVALPTEAQWEYACRAGTETRFSCGDELTKKDANFIGLDRTSPVDFYPPNPWGLYDMHGNLWEWCADYFDEKYYGNSEKRNPENAATAEFRVFRGGSWTIVLISHCRSAYRHGDSPACHCDFVGCRVALRPD